MKFFLTVLLVSIGMAGFGQADGKYMVKFTDKNNSPYSVSSPLIFLSQRALDRRAHHNVAVTPEDFPVNPHYIDSVKSHGGIVINTSRWFNSAVAQISDPATYNKVNALPFVDTMIYVSPIVKSKKKKKNSKFKNEGSPVESTKRGDNDRATGSGVKSTKSINVIDYGQAYNQISMVQGDVLHNNGFTGDGMIIAVLDAGFLNANTLGVFDSLRQTARILGTRDFAFPGSDVYQGHSHGTNVLSLMGANVPTQMVGTAPHASFWLLRSEEASTEYIVEEHNWVAAAEFADSAGADVINSSLTYTEFFDTTMNHTYEDLNGRTTLVARAASRASAKGILPVISAGNYGNASWGYIGTPADADSVLSIGAVDATGTYATFSSRGPSYDGRVKPDIAGQGAGVTYADTWGGIVSGNGTSFSSPLIAGMMACLWQAHPSFTNVELMEVVRQSASQYMTPDSILGYGIPNFAAASLLLSGEQFPDFDEAQEMLVYPNPFNDHFNISFNSSDTQDVYIDLLDISGKIVTSLPGHNRNYGYNTIVLNGLDSLKAGIYILRMVSANHVATVKLMKND